MIFNLYKERIINAGSSIFLPLESEPIKDNDDEQRHFGGVRFLRQELLEHSGCARRSDGSNAV